MEVFDVGSCDLLKSWYSSSLHSWAKCYFFSKVFFKSALITGIMAVAFVSSSNFLRYFTKQNISMTDTENSPFSWSIGIGWKAEIFKVVVYVHDQKFGKKI